MVAVVVDIVTTEDELLVLPVIASGSMKKRIKKRCSDKHCRYQRTVSLPYFNSSTLTTASITFLGIILEIPLRHRQLLVCWDDVVGGNAFANSILHLSPPTSRN